MMRKQHLLKSEKIHKNRKVLLQARRKLRDESGVSIVIALILMLVCVLACISLYTITSTSLNNAADEMDYEKSLILAQEMAQRVRMEIETYQPSPAETLIYVDSDDEVQQAVLDIPTAAPASGTLSNYIYSKLGKGWGYYNPDEVFNSNLKNVEKKFPLEGMEDTSIKEASLTMYWTSDSESESSKGDRNDNRQLHVIVTVSVGDNKDVARVVQIYDYREMQTDVTVSVDEEESTRPYSYLWWEYSGLEVSQ